ncbi:MAG: hypothetical protein WCG23_05275 [bacterium]
MAYLSEFFNSVKQVKSNWKPYKKWEEEQEDKDAQKKELNKRVNIPQEQLNQASAYGKTLINTINVMDTYSINKAQDVEIATQAAVEMPITLAAVSTLIIPTKIVPQMKSVQKFIAKNPKYKIPITIISWAIPVAAFITGQAFGCIYSKHLEKEASRIARYQAREQALKDPRHFVVYDSDQVNEAKKIAKNMPNPVKEKKKSFLGTGEAISTIKSLRKDKDNYQKWKEANKKNEEERKNKLNKDISSEQLEEAKQQQQSILGTIKHIEIQSQNYLNNVEMGINSLTKSELLFGGVVGGIISGAAMLLQKIKPSLKNSKAVNSVKLGAIPAVIAASSVIVSLFVLPFTIKLQKEAAKIGRFKAKQELLNEPRNFIKYTDEQNLSVKDIKAEKKPKQGFIKNMAEEVKFLFKAQKDFKEYEEYSKKQKVEEDKLEEALKKVSLKSGQLEKAKSLQKKVFTSFEKMDEKAQRYADDTEAAAETVQGTIAQPLNFAGEAGTAGLFLKLKHKFNSKTNLASKVIWGALIAMPALLSTGASILLSTNAVKIKKQAVKIGLMEAMKDLDDPKNFAENTSPVKN